jgi:hypothetical protein
VSFALQWLDQPESFELPAYRSISNQGWWRILDEIVAQGVGDVTAPSPSRSSFVQRLVRRPPPVEFSSDVDVDPDACRYPVNIFHLTHHGTSVVTERACRAMLRRLNREATSKSERAWPPWPELWHWFYDYLSAAVEHGGFEVG